MATSDSKTKEISEALFHEVLWTAHHYSQLKELYRHSPERNRLLHESAAVFFDDLFYLYLERVILGICRVTDTRKDCLTFNFVAGKIKNALNEESRCKLPRILVNLKDISANLRSWRHKALAHVDAKAALSSVRNMGSFIWKEIDEFFRQSECFFTIAETNVNSLELTVQTGGVGQLVVRLIDAMCFDDLWKKEPKLAIIINNASAFQGALVESRVEMEYSEV